MDAQVIKAALLLCLPGGSRRANGSPFAPSRGTRRGARMYVDQEIQRPGARRSLHNTCISSTLLLA